MGNSSSSPERNGREDNHRFSRKDSSSESSRMSSSMEDSGSKGATRSRHSRHKSTSRERRRHDRHHKRGEEMSYLQMARQGYNELVNAIIRPPRAKYSKSALGPVRFRYQGKVFKRTDFVLENSRGMVLQCSHWEPDGWRYSEELPCVVYLHGNSSARPEALPQLEVVLSIGATMLSFDCSGSGLSDGEYVSLGYWERDDLEAVINYLRASGGTGPIALWGRSMGAATALLHGDRDPGIAAMVLDSAFSDLTQLAQEMVQRGRDAGLTLPNIAVKIALRMIRASVHKAADFNLKDLCPIKHANQTFIPALFIAAEGDTFIQPHHTKDIYEEYAGDKNMIIVEGDHNSTRPQFLHDSISIFLKNYLQIPPEWSLVDVEIASSILMEKKGEEYNKSSWTKDEEFMKSIRSSALDNESQLQIQEALFQMLAQDHHRSSTPPQEDMVRRSSHVSTKSSSAALNGSGHSGSRHSKSSDTEKLRLEKDGSPVLHPGFVGVEIIEDYSTPQMKQVKKTIRPSENGFFTEPWTCGACTLINEGYTEICSICGVSREAVKI